jgi:hypothetical protein
MKPWLRGQSSSIRIGLPVIAVTILGRARVAAFPLANENAADKRANQQRNRTPRDLPVVECHADEGHDESRQAQPDSECIQGDGKG